VLLRTFIDVWREDASALPVRVIDTRGAGGLGVALWRFGVAACVLIEMRARGRVACAHVNMTTRGSTLRKALLCVLARVLGVRVILHLHGADFFECIDALPGWQRRMLAWVFGGAHSIVVLGTQWRRRLARTLGLPQERIRVVPNGVMAAPRAMAPPGPARILFLGRIGRRKGVGELIAALADETVASRAGSATIAGDGDAACYGAEVCGRGLSGRVELLGWQDAQATGALLAEASIFVLPSHHEVMPIAVLEAMARGIAIVATPVGAIPEILADDLTALLVPPGDVAALAGALCRLLDDPDLRIRLGDAALGVFQARLDARRAAAALQTLYRDAARRASTRAEVLREGRA
jgi:glycosyltransferase involved in cell wall biosynthesis